MIKKCNVLLSNEAVCVVDFDGDHIQMPALKNIKSEYIFIALNDGIYSESTENEYVGFLNVTEKEIDASKSGLLKKK